MRPRAGNQLRRAALALSPAAPEPLAPLVHLLEILSSVSTAAVDNLAERRGPRLAFFLAGGLGGREG